jgi:hypothetical protein
MKKQQMIFVVLSTFSFVVACLGYAVLAQAPEFAPIYSGLPVKNVAWSSDSQKLTFQEAQSETDASSLSDSWLAFDTLTQSLQSASEWPLQPNLTSSLQQTFGTEQALTESNSFLFRSPDNRYIVGNEQLSAETGRDDLGIVVDTVANQTFALTIPLLGSETGPDLFDVHWSTNSEAFTLSTTALLATDPTFFYHISGYGDDSSKPIVQDLTQLIIGDKQYSTLEIYDVSSNGDLVLLRGFYVTPSPENRQMEFPLIVWNSKDASGHFVVDNIEKSQSDLLAATFASNNDSLLLILDERGLVQHNLTNNEESILRTDINSTWVNKAVFSPDGQSLALIEKVNDVMENVYVIELENTK